MNPLQNSLNTNTEEKGKVRLIHENLLKRLPPDILREMARRQLAEIKKAGYDVSGSAKAVDYIISGNAEGGVNTTLTGRAATP